MSSDHAKFCGGSSEPQCKVPGHDPSHCPGTCRSRQVGSCLDDQQMLDVLRAKSVCPPEEVPAPAVARP